MPATETELHQIGEVAERVGLSLRTVRYYEEEGLVRPAKRSDGGFRLYRQSEIARLELIKEMKPLGFTVQEMRQLLAARDSLERGEPGSAKHDKALDRLAAYVAETKERTEELRRKLDAADVFSRTLAGELRRHRRAASPARS